MSKLSLQEQIDELRDELTDLRALVYQIKPLAEKNIVCGHVDTPPFFPPSDIRFDFDNCQIVCSAEQDGNHART